MGRIRKKEIRILDSQHDGESISYCQRCLKFNIYSILQERVYLPDEPIPHDHELWKQCHTCGQIVPIYETKRESKLQDFVEVSDNPFDSGQSITGLRNKKPKSSYEKQRQKLLERIDKGKDEDIKRELRKGNSVEIIEDY